MTDSVRLNYKKYLESIASLADLQSKKLMKNIMSLETNQTKNFVETMYWRKNRYYITDDIEYYLTEKSKFELQFTLILLKEQLKPKLTEADFNRIAIDKNFIQGVFYSNKKEIIFTD